ncbi:MAG: hypothetical protein ACUVXG_14480 [Anaerolineae bacterium]
MARRRERPAKSSRWRDLRRNKAQLLFWILGLLVVLSMILSLVIVALPEPEPPTPTPTPMAWLLPLGAAFRPRALPLGA